MLSTLRNWQKRLTGLLRPSDLDEPSERFIRYNKNKWRPQTTSADAPVVLVGVFPHCLQTWCYTYVVNHLARKTGARIQSFHFGRARHRGAEKIYASFGAPLGLSRENAKPFRDLATRRADEIFRSLRTKADIENIEFEGAIIGDLIYDTYLRVLAVTTIEVGDPRLKDFIYDALLIAYACRDYFARHKVVAVIPDHVVYVYCGIIARMAAKKGIPVYLTYFGHDFYLHALDIASPPYPIRWPHYKYRELFAQLDPEERERAIEAGGNALRARLEGTVNDFILKGQSAYSKGTGTRVLEETGRPKILVLLHDFCDAVHVYRGYLFPDFEEWVAFLFSRAVKTPFDWYVKPHPNVNNMERSYRPIRETNCGVLTRLKNQFPSLKFLEPTVSNRQIVEEGISAMFTVCGTAGHEFAYLGVPVVNAGDNPHCEYGFNILPKSLEEYERYIERADRLDATIDKREVEEYFYMNYFYFPEKHRAGVTPFDPALLGLPHINRSEIYDDLISAVTPERDQQIAEYFDRLFPDSDQPAASAWQESRKGEVPLGAARHS